MNITNLASNTTVTEQVKEIAEKCKLAIDGARDNAFNGIDSALHAAKTKAEEIDRFTKLNVLDLAGAVFFGTHDFEQKHDAQQQIRIDFYDVSWNTVTLFFRSGHKYKITLLVTEEKDGK